MSEIDSIIDFYAEMRGYNQRKSTQNSTNLSATVENSAEEKADLNLSMDPGNVIADFPRLIEQFEQLTKFAKTLNGATEIIVSELFHGIRTYLERILPLDSEQLHTFVTKFGRLESEKVNVSIIVGEQSYELLEKYIANDMQENCKTQCIIAMIFSNLPVTFIKHKHVLIHEEAMQIEHEDEKCDTRDIAEPRNPTPVPEDFELLLADFLGPGTSEIPSFNNCLPPVHSYTVNSAPSHIICADLCENMAVFGLEDSSVVMTSLNNEFTINNCNKTTYQLKMPPTTKVKCQSKYGDWIVARGHNGTVYDCKIVHNTGNRYVLSCSEDSTVRLWDCENGGQCAYSYRGHNFPIWKLAIDRSPICWNYFATASWDNTCRVFSSERLEAVRVLCGHDSSVDCVAFSPIGCGCEILATGCADGSVRVWNINQAMPIRLLAAVPQGASIECIEFSPCGGFISASVHNGRVYIWEIDSGRLVCLSNPGEFHSQGSTNLHWFSNKEQQWLFSCALDGKLRAQTVNLGKLGSKIVREPVSHSVLAMRFTPKSILTIGTNQ